MNNLIAYYESFDGYTSKYKPLNPTGRWKIRKDRHGKCHMLIEHKVFIFKSWIHESGISFHEEETEVINVCNSELNI